MPLSENKFYSFNIKYTPQLKTNWCWAACFQWISKSLNLISEIGNTQYDFVSYYNKFYKNSIHNCDKTSSGYNCNIPIDFDDIPYLVKDAFGFNCQETDFVSISNNRTQLSLIVNKMLDYDFVKSTLNLNNFPIIIAVSTGDAPNHILLITGYGTQNGCEYILISDPNNKRGEEFWVDDKYISKITRYINKIWVAKNTFNDETKIKEDNFINYYTDKSIEFNQSIKNNISIPYEDNFGIIFLAQDINDNIINYKDRDSNLLLSDIYEKIKTFEFRTYCDRFMRKQNIENLEIIFNSLKNYLETGVLDINLNDFENVFSEYQTRIKLNDIQGDLYVNIKEAPDELNLVNKNILNNEFHKILETHKNN